MGWLYKTSLDGFAGPRQYLDAQFTYEGPGLSSFVLRSALVRMSVYYAAVKYRRTDQAEMIFAAVCLVRFNPRVRDGYIFGYKDMEESMGPHEATCPGAILDLLTPTDNAYALAWRERCRTNVAARRASSAKPTPRPGQTIVFDSPLQFQDGRSFDRLLVVANPRSHRTVWFKDPSGGGLYRIPNIKGHTYRWVGPDAR